MAKRTVAGVFAADLSAGQLGRVNEMMQGALDAVLPPALKFDEDPKLVVGMALTALAGAYLAICKQCGMSEDAVHRGLDIVNGGVVVPS